MAGKSKRITKPSVRAAARMGASQRSAETKIATVKKPVFRAGTWIAILLLASLIAFAVYLNKRKSALAAEATPTAGITYAFADEKGKVNRIEIKASAGDGVKVELGADAQWKLIQPIPAKAEQGSAQAAADQVRTLQVLGDIDNVALEILELDKPDYTVTIGFEGGRQRQVEVGSITPTQSGYYARVDGKKLVIISKTGVDSLLNLLQSPPYAETPTPSPLPPTETPAVSIEATPTP
jgi:hypothetical protein